MATFLYRAIPTVGSVAARDEPLEEQIFRSETEFKAGDALPLRPGIWTVERVEQTGTTVWASEVLRSLNAPEQATARSLHCRVESESSG